jgi:hypothetical protein
MYGSVPDETKRLPTVAKDSESSIAVACTFLFVVNKQDLAMKLTPLAFALSVLCSAALAQEPAAPASQLQKFQPLIGNWELSGTMRATPDAPETPWTARESNQWALGGHFVHQEVVIKFGGGMPDLAFTNFLGWDNENGGYVSFGAGNQGMVAKNDVHFSDDNTMLIARTAVVEGQLIVEREVVRIGDGTYTFEINTAMGDGPFFTQVQGSAKKASAAGEALLVNAAMSMAPPSPEMAMLEKMAGEYEFKGTMILAPGAPAMEITGNEEMRMIMGGTVMESHISGEAAPGMPPYEAYGYMAWNPVDKCYDSISVDNMGMSGEVQLRALDDRTMVVTMAAVMNGQPTVNRTLLTLDAQGRCSAVVVHSIAGAGEPQQTFSATYRKIR